MQNIQEFHLFDNDQNFQKQKQESIDQLIQNPNILKFLSDHSLNREFIEDNWVEFLDYQEDLQICQNCKDLSQCQKVSKGMQQLLCLENEGLKVNLTPCRFGKALLDKQHLLSHITVSNVSDDLLLSDSHSIKDIMNKEFLQNLREQIKAGTVTEQEPMNKHTSFAIGGPADVFVQPATREEIRSAVYCAKEAGIPFFVMGNGSNLLVSDEGFRGMIIQIGKNFQAISVKDTVIEVQAGALLSRTARAAWNAGLTGFEFAAGIPGSVGGAVAMNAGAYGGEMKHIITSVKVLDQDGQIYEIAGADMEFGYRHSKAEQDGLVVLEAVIELQTGDMDKIDEEMKRLAEARISKQPLEYPSAGSTFKRPEGYFAGKLIMDAGLRGYTVGGAQVSEKHCGFVVNKGGATAADVMQLVDDVKKKVKDSSGVDLELEIKTLGAF